ncbi:MAG: hypothetical protein J6Z08_03555 [Elusimicrobiales bacterium]|nr:hypothetical protein [Elusimicrobiales bacterium]
MRLLSLFSAENLYSGRMEENFVMPGIDSSYETNILRNENLTDSLPENKYSPVILFNPESSSNKRSLSPKKTLSVAKKILENSDCNIRILSYKYKIDFPKDFFSKKMSKRICIAKADNLHKLFSEVKKADYLLTVETSSAHIAEMFGKPMTALFKIMLNDRDKCGNFNFKRKKISDGINFFDEGCFPCEENYDKKRCMECSLCAFFVRNSNADILVGFDCQENIPDNSIVLSCMAGLCSLKR